MLRFAASRLVDPQAVARIAQSIERCGQIVPCITALAPGGTGAGAAPLVLIDGYRRVAALRRLGRDTARVEQWTCGLAEAVLGVLARAQDRSFASIEEALLLRELVQGQGLSQHELARAVGAQVRAILNAAGYNRDHKPSNLLVHPDSGPIVLDTVAIRAGAFTRVSRGAWLR